MGPGRNHPAGGREGGAPRRAGTIGGRGGSALEAPWAWAGSVSAAPAGAGPGAWAEPCAGGWIPGWPRGLAALFHRAGTERLWWSRVSWPCPGESLLLRRWSGGWCVHPVCVSALFAYRSSLSRTKEYSCVFLFLMVYVKVPLRVEFPNPLSRNPGTKDSLFEEKEGN